MMTVDIMKRMKVMKIDLDKADVVKQEVCSRDEVMHVGINGLWFSTKSWLEGEQE